MKNILRSPHLQARIWLGLVALLAGLGTMHAQLNLNIPNAGSDGALVINAETESSDHISVVGTNVVIDLGKAGTAIWDADNSSNIGKGIYDPEKWAVVFKYSSVSIADGKHVSFKNHPSRAPVVWLVESNVTIGENCTLNLNGNFTLSGSIEQLNLTEPGPGGFRGPADGPSGRGTGYGPGGGDLSASHRGTYGNPQIMPLIGGSGSIWMDRFAAYGGSTSGGGAILIIAREYVELDGKILAKPGSRVGSNRYSSSGGAIRIVADEIKGGKSSDFVGGIVDAEPEGRIRIEANDVSDFLKLSPSTAAVPLGSGATPVIWPATTAPSVRVISVDTSVAPADPLVCCNS